MSNHINEILFALTDANVEFVVGGGMAALLHGVERVTLDVDVALKMDAANVEKFLSVMAQLGPSNRRGTRIFSISNNSKSLGKAMNPTKTEIKPSADFEAALARSEPQDFDGHTEFQRLTAGQRLDWLCQAVTVIHQFKGKARVRTGVPERKS